MSMSVLSYTTIKYAQIYDKKLKFTDTYPHTYRPDMAPFPVQGNVNKCKKAVSNRDCTKLTVPPTALLS